MAKNIEEFNAERRQLDQEITEEILGQLDDDKQFSKFSSTVVYGSDWKKGVIVIVASRFI